MADVRGGGTARKVITGLVVAAILAALLLAGRQAAAAIPRFAERVEELGTLGPLLFMAGYVVATVAFVPGSLLTLAAGAIFGLPWGVVWVFIGATTGAAAAFLVARHIARGAVERRLSGNPKFVAIDHAIGRRGLRIVLLLRLSPAFPFNLMNYALGLTPVRFRDYVLASVGMLPGTLLYVYYGKVAGDVAALAAGLQPGRGAEYYAMLAIGLVATIAVTVVVTRAARRALREVTG